MQGNNCQISQSDCAAKIPSGGTEMYYIQQTPFPFWRESGFETMLWSASLYLVEAQEPEGKLEFKNFLYTKDICNLHALNDK